MTRYIKKYILIILTLCLFVACSKPHDNDPDVISGDHFLGQSSGMFINLSEMKTQQDVDNAINFAKSINSNSIYVNSEDSEKLDFLKYVSETASKKNFQVHAVVNTKSADTNKIKQNIDNVLKYKISGILLDYLESDVDTKSAQEIAEHIRYRNKNIKINIAVNYRETNDKEILKSLVSNANPDRLSVHINSSENYSEMLEEISSLSLNETPVLIINEYNPDNKYTFFAELLENNIYGDISGTILKTYSNLSKLSKNDVLMLSSSFSVGGTKPPANTLVLDNEKLSVYHPPENYSTTENGVFVVGLSNPKNELTINGKTPTSLGKNGTYGEFVKLNPGQNTIQIKNGDDVVKLTVNRVQSIDKTISEIPKNALFPTSELGFDSNDTVNISVIAPANWTVTATVGTNTIVLNQVKSRKKPPTGTPVEFTGSFNFRGEKIDPNSVTSLGKITYILSYGSNQSKVQTSVGEILVAGKNVPLYAEVNTQIATARKDISKNDYLTALKQGSIFEVHKKSLSQEDDHKEYFYRLADGSYVAAKDTKIVRDVSQIQKKISEVSVDEKEKFYDIKLIGARHSIVSSMTENEIVFKFLDTTLNIPIDGLKNDAIQSVSIKNEKNLATLKLSIDKSRVWGYDIRYIDGNTHLYIRKTPTISPKPDKPLDGLIVLLDAGHGGANPGALGAAGSKGPTEAMINDIYTTAIKFKLTQLGATVYRTRASGTESNSLQERLGIADKLLPDIFISVHHNSTNLDSDINSKNGVEIYYNNTISKTFSENLINSVSQALGRNAEKPREAGYYVTRMTYAPAVLLELGYIINPLEYENTLQIDTILKAAVAVSEAVLKTVLGE